ncbi:MULTISPECIES: hypothetical protein [unclassified Micromonospora]|uniref:Uncharacterized protein n=1 Tax=Micromonospora reichwaldensis TaxID=3075516 RepID=A0ABU2WY51_9ACTN|nr:MULTISPECIES: hypothetical protein [unclassified Micromonospora]MDT0530450.1 hypothetical protein [Micromonospora sp. DSM 115977]RLK23278.1 hypothetical protein DER29_1138 [Micromonospora sp. M71_S20]WSG04546.1 hypothetical protein OG989_12945 [Micromonospora sp. NBC_01740]
MNASRPARLPRRGVLGMSALVATAVAVAAKPATASAAPLAAPKAECLADLLGES